jgi:3-deoxy-manno-octulosonate cytidylyltransferase (CMP-KDO synthetase)
MKVVGIIPARYKSSRFPGKPLALILGIPLVIRVCKKVEVALGKGNTFVATDDNQIKQLVESYGYQVIMTSSNAKTGTDRLYEAAKLVAADVYINIQGDEPMVNPTDILKIAKAKEQNMDLVINGMHQLGENENPADINIPKVVATPNGKLIYMSRLPIPGIKDSKIGMPIYKKQICIYAFTYKELKAFGECEKKGNCELFEDIEILRFLDLGIEIKMVDTANVSMAVDNPEDIEKVETAIKKLGL